MLCMCSRGGGLETSGKTKETVPLQRSMSTSRSIGSEVAGKDRREVF
jgi:hypothetical protein